MFIYSYMVFGGIVLCECHMIPAIVVISFTESYRICLSSLGEDLGALMKTQQRLRLRMSFPPPLLTGGIC